MKTKDLTDLFDRPRFAELYGEDAAQRTRWNALLQDFEQNFSGRDLHFFSAPGRTELGGNHTDHNNGVVLAAAIDLDSIAVAARTDTGRVSVISDGFADPFEVDLGVLRTREDELRTTSALIRGIASRIKSLDLNVGGFDAYISSDVLIGSGLSSSASIEVLIGTIFNALYNDSEIDALTIAKIGQFAENEFFGKPSGLMDQIACAVGGVVAIDIENANEPVITRVEVPQIDEFDLIVVDTGGSHADLTEEYASIPREMRSVAGALGKETARELDFEEVVAQIPLLRKETGDRAVLRVLHFLAENRRVREQVTALQTGDMKTFLSLVRDSGNSSCKWLQNCSNPASPCEQSLLLALALTETFLSSNDGGACRVHGGGFAGTIQVWLPRGTLDEYRKLITPIFGEGSVCALRFRRLGAVEI